MWTKERPFLAVIRKRELLTREGSEKRVVHFEVDISGSGIHYKVGDSVGIWPQNRPELVEAVLKRVGFQGDERVTARGGEEMGLRDFLGQRANLARGTKKLLAAGWQNGRDVEGLDLLDILQELPRVAWHPQQLIDLLQPLLPRFYSIASSPLVHPNEVHLTVAAIEYDERGRRRHGVCSHYLERMVPLGEACVPLYLQPSKDFTLPEEGEKSILMIGPGTGVAPYRGFLQQRLAAGARGKNWLIFGERNAATDFFYEEFWRQHEKSGQLKLDLAFSRDQSQKVYVQHRLQEQAAQVWRWLEEGAIFYVCGDAKRMAPDVDEALRKIIGEQGGKDEQAVHAYVKQMRADKRYLRDIY